MVHSDIFAITFAVLTMYTLFAPDITVGIRTQHRAHAVAGDSKHGRLVLLLRGGSLSDKKGLFRDRFQAF